MYYQCLNIGWADKGIVRRAYWRAYFAIILKISRDFLEKKGIDSRLSIVYILRKETAFSKEVTANKNERIVCAKRNSAFKRNDNKQK
jgi:hypothetical protein